MGLMSRGSTEWEREMLRLQIIQTVMIETGKPYWAVNNAWEDLAEEEGFWASVTGHSMQRTSSATISQLITFLATRSTPYQESRR